MDYELIKPDEQDAYDPAPFLNYARARTTDKAERDPLVGDIVHFWDDAKARCRAAVVTSDEDLRGVELTVFLPGQGGGPARVPLALHNEIKAGLSWHWPCGGQ